MQSDNRLQLCRGRSNIMTYSLHHHTALHHHPTPCTHLISEPYKRMRREGGPKNTPAFSSCCAPLQLVPGAPNPSQHPKYFWPSILLLSSTPPCPSRYPVKASQQSPLPACLPNLSVSVPSMLTQPALKEPAGKPGADVHQDNQNRVSGIQ